LTELETGSLILVTRTKAIETTMMKKFEQAAGTGEKRGMVGHMRVVLFGSEASSLRRSRASGERPRIRRLAFAGNAAPPGGSPPL